MSQSSLIKCDMIKSCKEATSRPCGETCRLISVKNKLSISNVLTWIFLFPVYHMCWQAFQSMQNFLQCSDPVSGHFWGSVSCSRAAMGCHDSIFYATAGIQTLLRAAGSIGNFSASAWPDLSKVKKFCQNVILNLIQLLNFHPWDNY